ncbi:hypothetical protein GCM10009422_14990 [Brevundimonas kwangchunensis]|uniref:Uncharacterized protein n=1 Tax=Brevundimonas kwangchunensis TaxID=322163 RepID=A0ABN1GUX3_9CAUL
MLAHALVLGGLGLRTIHMETTSPAPEQVILVEIEPRPLLENEQPRPTPSPSPASASSEPRPAPATQPTVFGLRLPFQRQTEDDEDQSPSPPAPRAPAGAAPAGAPAPPAGGWTVRPDTLGDRIGRGLRTRGPGCASPQLLTEAERTVCDERFGERAAAAPPIDGTGDARRDAELARQGARELQQYEARRRPLSGGSGLVGPQDGVGSNFGIGVAGAHLDPSLRPDSTQNIRTRRDGPRASGTPMTPGASSPRDTDDTP